MEIKHLHLKSCESTQEELKQQLSTSLPLLISTEEQTKGRGTHHRTWDFYPSSLAMSFSLLPHPKMTLTSLELGVLIADFFHSYNITLKWPNDLMNPLAEKVGGILIESINGILICGLGINIQSSQQYSHQANYKIPHGNIDLSLGPYQGYDQKKLCHHLYSFILKNRIQDTWEVTHRWNQLCCHLNKGVSLMDDEEKKHYIFLGVGEDGQAIIKTEHGKESLYSGSIILD
jgi:BirA family biotin operon repressor/biotin-[acetyl-CoA-carboxylase] ligase